MNHGQAFQALWSRLRTEVRQLQARGYYGDGMYSRHFNSSLILNINQRVLVFWNKTTRSRSNRRGRRRVPRPTRICGKLTHPISNVYRACVTHPHEVWRSTNAIPSYSKSPETSTWSTREKARGRSLSPHWCTDSKETQGWKSGDFNGCFHW